MPKLLVGSLFPSKGMLGARSIVRIMIVMVVGFLFGPRHEIRKRTLGI